MAVEFDRSIEVETPAEQVWARILELDCIPGWVPIIHDLEEIEHLARYEAVLQDSVGPFKLSADLDIFVTEHEHPSWIRIHVDGEDRHVGSRVRIEGTLTLEPTDAGSRLRFHGEYEVTGRVATLGASMIRTKATAMLDAFEVGAREEFG